MTTRYIFTDLYLLWVLLPLTLGWAAIFVWRQRRHRHDSAILFGSLAQLSALPVTWVQHARTFVEFSRIFTVGCIVVGLLRPQWGSQRTYRSTDALDILLVVDTSGSMEALDLDAQKPLKDRRNRLEVARDVIQKFVKQRPTDQLGLVVFGAQAFTQAPLTLDHNLILQLLGDLRTKMAGDATAIGDGLAVAIKRLSQSKAKSKVIILLTDGRNNAGAMKPNQASEIAKSMGIKIYAIGAGAQGKAPFLVDTMFGTQVAYDEVDIDDAGLTTLAQTTGGTYFRAEDERALTAIYAQIDKLERTRVETLDQLEYHEAFPPFIWAALGLLLFEILLLETRLRRIP